MPMLTFSSLAKRTLLALTVAFAAYVLMLFLVGLASAGNLLPSNPMASLALVSLGVNGTAAFCGVMAGTARLLENRRKAALAIGGVFLAFDVIGQAFRMLAGNLSLAAWPHDIWYSLAWYAGVGAAVALRAYRHPVVVERVAAR